MEDQNMLPLEPDMLYRHSLPGSSPEIPEPEVLPVPPVPAVETPDPIAEEPQAAAEPEAPAEEPPVEEIPAEEAPVEEVPVEDAPTEEVPAEETPVEGTAAMEAPVEDTSAEKIPVPEEPLETSPAEVLPMAAFPIPTLPDQDPAGEPQPTVFSGALGWQPAGELPTEEAAPPQFYQTYAPEEPLPPIPEPAAPEYTDMNTKNSGEEEPPAMKKKHKKANKNAAPAVKKGRPKRKKGYGLFGLPHLLSTLLWLAIIMAIGVSLGKLMWIGAADVLAFGREDSLVTVTIVESDSIDTIAAKLQEVGLVKYPELFKVYAKLTGSDEEITTGTFTLNTRLDYHALTNALSPSSSSRSVVTVTIPEGYSCRQVFNLLAASNVCSVESLEEYAASGELGDYWFLEGVERDDKYCLEGFLFPDTYEFYENSTPKEALTRMLNGFENRYTEEMQEQLNTLNEYLTAMMQANGKDDAYIASNLFTVRDVITVASLIEEETSSSGESAVIASVIYNRLYNWGDYPAYLNMDASIYYALDGNIDPATGNTKVLTQEDLKIDSPYNTYLHTGLTPGPITNPGLASIQAALSPQDTEYYFYVLNPETGVHQFSSTQEEHDAWIAEFYPSSSEDAE